MELRWLSVSERIQFKRAVLVFRCLHGTAPPTLLTSCSQWQPWSHAEGCDPRPRPDWTSRERDGLPYATVHSVLLVLTCGTICHQRHRMYLRCLYLGSC